LKAVDRPFTQIVNGTSQFVIPVFQRDYSWTEAQCEQLWSDVVTVAKRDSSRGHFLGSVVYVPTGASSAGFTQWLLIDGQQRVTTLSLLLAALRDHILETGWSGNDDDPTPKKIDAYFLKNIQEDGERQHKLVLRRHDQSTLESLVHGTEMPKEPSDRLVENYEYFRDMIRTEDPADIYRGIGRLVIVDVTLDRNSDDPQLIFESLNSTGIDLSESDLIRNFLLMRLPETEQTYLYNTHWSKIEELFRGSEKTFDSYARDYLALKTRTSKQEKASQIYQAFRRNFSSLVDQLGSLEALLEEMLRFARYYAAFSLGVGAPKKLAMSLGRLRRLVDVPATLIMRLYDCHDRLENLSEADLNLAVHSIEGYVFRRAICGEQTRGYWQIFANLAYKIDPENPLESLQVELARLRDNYRYPSDSDFRKALLERDLYGLRVCFHLLEQLENYGSKEPTDVSSYSIEHVMPQNENLSKKWRDMLGPNWKETHSTWLHRLGNLTLTGYNSSYSDRPFAEKQSISGGFEDSSVRLNKFIRGKTAWTDSEIEERGSLLAKRALTIWPSLKVEESLIAAAEQREMRDRAARRNLNDVDMSEVAHELFNELRKHILAMGDDILEMPETKTVSYHGPDFFLEVLPRKHRLTLLLPLDFNEIEDPHGIASDATEWKFFFYAKHEGGVSIRVKDKEAVLQTIPIIKQAYNLACR
jgi:predicted transport protein